MLNQRSLPSAGLAERTPQLGDRVLDGVSSPRRRPSASRARRGSARRRAPRAAVVTGRGKPRGADKPDRDDRRSRRQREPRCAAVEGAVRKLARRPLRKDPDHLAVSGGAGGGTRERRAVAGASLDRERPERVDHLPEERIAPELRLRHVADRPRRREREKQRIEQSTRGWRRGSPGRLPGCAPSR